MSLPIYDSCRPSSRYFSFNEKQPDSSILAINKNMESLRMTASPKNNLNQKNHSINESHENHDRINGSFNLEHINGHNTGFNNIINSNINININSNNSSSSSSNDYSMSGSSSDESSYGVFLTKNYRFVTVIFSCIYANIVFDGCSLT